MTWISHTRAALAPLRLAYSAIPAFGWWGLSIYSSSVYDDVPRYALRTIDERFVIDLLFAIDRRFAIDLLSFVHS